MATPTIVELRITGGLGQGTADNSRYISFGPVRHQPILHEWDYRGYSIVVSHWAKENSTGGKN